MAQALMAHDPHDPFQVVVTSPNYAQDQTVFAATNNLALKEGIYLLLKSTDGGNTWAPIENMPNNNQMLSIAFSSSWATDQTLFVGGVDGLFKTTDGGTSWQQLSKQGVESVALSPNYASDKTVFIATSKKTVLVSTNGGNKFSAVTAPAV